MSNTDVLEELRKKVKEMEQDKKEKKEIDDLKRKLEEDSFIGKSKKMFKELFK